MSLNVGSKPRRSEQGKVTEAPPASGCGSSHSKVNKNFAAAVDKLPPESRLALKPCGNGSPNRRARRAIRDNNVEALSLLLGLGFKVNADTLITAMQQQDGKALQLLLSRYPKLQKRCALKMEIYVCSAIREGKFQHVKSLLDHGVKPTPTMMMFGDDSTTCEFQQLLFDRYEPDAFLSENASTVTMHLTPYVKALVDRGADINVLSENGMSMLHRACGEGNVDCVRVLLECGANVNLPTVKGVPAIHMARRHNDADTVLTVIRLLCHHGADPAATINGKDPMIVLSKEEHWSKIVVCLLGNGMVKDWSRYDKTLVEYASKRTAKVFLDGTRNGDQQMVHDSLRAKVYLLTAEDGSVRDDCAVSLIRALDEHGHLLSEETGKMVQKALSEYIEKYEPSSTLRSFIAIYNAEELREEALSELADAKLKPVGIREDFGVIGNYSPADGLSLIKLARSWLINSKEDHMVYVMAILKYVAEKAVQPEKASRAVRVKLHNAVVALLAEVAHSGIPTLEERASHIRDFLGRAPFALDGLN